MKSVVLPTQTCRQLVSSSSQITSETVDNSIGSASMSCTIMLASPTFEEAEISPSPSKSC